ncbi:MAG: excisionase [Candidatus Thiodiazotropha lotti]|nr:excisionase [Candidatus Thiodiazotropha lotti]MCW4216652.1 excisionase [Candidatus Thiodiazotropha lotti]
MQQQETVWVTVARLSDMSGYSERAIYNKKHKLTWKENVHWRKAPDGRLLFNPLAITAWIEGRAV